MNSVLASACAYYAYLYERGEVVSNPFLVVDRLATGTVLPKNIPNEDDLGKLLDRLADFLRPGESLRMSKRRYRSYVVAEFLYGTGMRISEASGVQLCDLDCETRTVKIRDVKTKKERYGVFSEYTAAVVGKWLSLRELVLKNPGSPLLFGSSANLRVTVNEDLKTVCRELGQDPVTCHSFRHAYAYHLLKAGCDIRKIQGLLGHAKLSSTQVYAKVDTESLKAVLDRYHPRKSRNHV
ncbi:tyrosine-type recombinase/integrase [Marispirochaeta sp.]|uniref:tyrosine-type recombinase/integrase n=1 Tax=Marispirochaeta sp. TaxID=2038653 RepID=UPI0029C76BF5|nr:tyrosine-type recombinase/integrase [Marispirochaeta sp.]